MGRPDLSLAPVERAEICGYLAAMIDGEGSVQCRKYSGRTGYVRQVQICNTDEAIIAHVCYCLSSLGIAYGLGTHVPEPPRKPLHRVLITGRANLFRLIELPIQSFKLDRLSEIHQTYYELKKSDLSRPGYCQCGCGQRINPGRRFLRGHNCSVQGRGNHG